MGKDTEILTLYKNPKLYNGSRYKVFQDDLDYGKWLEENSDKEIYVRTVYFKSISEPINIQGYIKDYDEYTYGSITSNDRIYYIFIDSITADGNEITTIKYSVDWWSSKWNSINCTKANITRKPTKPEYMAQPFTPFKPECKLIKSLRNSKGCLVFSFIHDVSKKDYMSWGVIDLKDINGVVGAEIGEWSNMLKDIAPSSVLSAWVLPLFSKDDFATWEEVNEGKVKYRYSKEDGTANIPTLTYRPITPFTTTEKKVMGICDWNGNTVWECPVGITIDMFDIEINLSPNSCFLRFVYDNSYVNETVNRGFSYNCKRISLFIDQQVEYTWRERDAEIMMRKIQSEKQVWSAFSDAIQGAGFGLAFGGSGILSKKGITQGGWGLESALAGGILNTLSTWTMNSIFDPMIQQAQDTRHIRMKDEMSIISDSITPLYKSSSLTNLYSFGFYDNEVPTDYDETDRFNKILSDIGYTPLENSIIYVYGLGYKNEITDLTTKEPEIKTYNVYIYKDKRWIKYGEKQVYYVFQYPQGEALKPEEFKKYFGTDPDENDIFIIPNNLWFGARATDLYDGGFIYRDGKWTAIMKGWFDNQPMVTDIGKFYMDNPYQLITIEGEFGHNLLNIYETNMDKATAERMDNDIRINGYYCDEITDNLQSMFGKGNVIQANNVVVEGNCTLEGKQQVVYRLQNGVEFI